MTTEIEKLGSFARRLVESYEDNTELDSICNLENYDEARHSHREFSQIGKRSNLPRRFFRSEGVVLKPLIQQFIDSITTGEVVSVLSSITTAAEEGEIDSFEVSEFTYESIIVESFGHVYDPDLIFIPNTTDFRVKLNEWRENNRIKYEEDGTYIAGASDIKVKWLPSKWGIEDILLYNTDDVDVVQKRSIDKEYPEYIDPIDDLDIQNPNDRMMVYLGKQFDGEEDEYELLIRTIISEAKITGYMPHGATVINLADELLPQDYYQSE